MGQTQTKRSGYTDITRPANLDDIFKSYPFFVKYEGVGMTEEAAISQLRIKCRENRLPSFRPLPGDKNGDLYCGMWDTKVYNTVFIGKTDASENGIYLATVYCPTFGSDKTVYV